MSANSRIDNRRWRSHPVRAGVIRAVVFVVPVLVSIGVGILVARILPTPQTTLELIAWWVTVLVASTIAVFGTDRWARRLLPLATLMRLSMLFPDSAPSRLKLARRVAGSRAIAAELQRSSRAGIDGDRQEAAETILTLVGALGDYDTRTRGHSERTQLFVTMLADELKLRDEDRGRLMWAALVHDIGKLKVPQDVLNKPSKPSEDEWKVLHSHPHEGALICEPLREWLGEWYFAIEQHHERFDGTGYPHGLAGQEISYGARIVAVADSYEVMTASRPYKKPMSAAAARAELTRCAGTQFDPDIVRAFLNISLGHVRRSTGPIAWVAQLLLVRPGPILGQAFGATAGATATVASVVALNLATGAAGSPAASAHADHTLVGARQPGQGQGQASTPAQESPGSSSDPTPTTPDGTPDDPSSNPRPTTGSTGPTGTPRPSPDDDPTPTPDNDPDPTQDPDDDPTTDPPTQPPTTPPPASDPMVLRDDEMGTREDVVQSIDVFRNDKAPDGEVLELVAADGAAHGALTRSADGTVTYTPAAHFHGSDAFTYTAMDEEGATSTADVTVLVAAVNDAPDAVNDGRAILEDATGVQINLLANDHDVDGDNLSVTSVGNPAHGSAQRGQGGVVVYTPSPNYFGPDTFSYTVTDGGSTDTATVTVSVTPVNDAPVVLDESYTTSLAGLLIVGAGNGVLANDRDVDGDRLEVISDSSTALNIAANGSFNFVGVFPRVLRINYVVSDGTTTVTGTVTITVRLL